MSFLNIFFLGLFFENIFVWHAMGLGIIVLFSYTLKEAFWVGLRFIVFLLIQTFFIIILKPYFDFPGKELFLLVMLIGIEVLLSSLIDYLLPNSYIENTIYGFVKRGDAILPLAFSTIITKSFSPAHLFSYALGLGLGFMLVLMMVAAIAVMFHFHRLPLRYTYGIKLFLLGIISIISY